MSAATRMTNYFLCENSNNISPYGRVTFCIVQSVAYVIYKLQIYTVILFMKKAFGLY